MDKVTKQSVNYRRHPLGVLSVHRCGNCSMFLPPGRDGDINRVTGHCTLVAGLIRARDICDRWKSR